MQEGERVKESLTVSSLILSFRSDRGQNWPSQRQCQPDHGQNWGDWGDEGGGLALLKSFALKQ